MREEVGSIAQVKAIESMGWICAGLSVYVGVSGEAYVKQLILRGITLLFTMVCDK